MLTRLLSARAIRPTDGWVLTVVVVSLSIATVAILFGLMAAIRKARRDRHEREQRLRRDSFAHSLQEAGGDPDAALEAAVGSQRAQTDLAAILLAYHRDGSDLADLAGYQLLVADLSAQLSSRRPLRRGTAILLLNLLRAPGGISAARAGLADRDADVRLASARSLGIVASFESAQALLDALRARPLPIPAERLIERLHGRWALQPCLDALARAGEGDVEAVQFRSDIARALALIASSQAEPALIRLLSSREPEERINAARALGRCGTRACLPALQERLGDPAPFVRAQAAKALGELGFAECAPALARVMTDRVWWVRSNAATALGKLGTTGQAALLRVADNPDRFASQRAHEELAYLEHA